MSYLTFVYQPSRLGISSSCSAVSVWRGDEGGGWESRGGGKSSPTRSTYKNLSVNALWEPVTSACKQMGPKFTCV